jgi:hypothetical protein
LLPELYHLLLVLLHLELYHLLPAYQLARHLHLPLLIYLLENLS